MVAAFKCSHRSAPIQDDRWINCPYCGALLAKPTVNPLKAVVAPERFAAVDSSAQFGKLMRHAPSSISTLAGMSFRTAFLLLFTIVTGVVTVRFLAVGALAFIPGVICAVSGFMLACSISLTSKFAAARLERFVAVVRDERTTVSGGDENTPVQTQYFLLLERRDGLRREYPASAVLAGQSAPGDIGVAFVRGGILLDFKRVDA